VCSRRWTAKSVPGQPPRYCSEKCRKEAAKARAREWFYANPERVAQQPSRQAAVKAEYNAAYYEANREAMLERASQYRRDHPEWRRAWNHARYAMTRGAVDAERFTLDEIYARDKGVCYLCGQDCPREVASMDHVIPVALGGPHTRANVRLADRSCNSSKRHTLLDPDDPRLTQEKE
jgi:5-methylcytosine-specific restriction endonuclease McrA